MRTNTHTCKFVNAHMFENMIHMGTYAPNVCKYNQGPMEWYMYKDVPIYIYIYGHIYIYIYILWAHEKIHMHIYIF